MTKSRLYIGRLFYLLKHVPLEFYIIHHAFNHIKFDSWNAQFVGIITHNTLQNEVDEMGFHALVLKVLIASPSDVEMQRDEIETAINQWNKRYSEEVNVILLPRRWEDEVPSYNRNVADAQKILNEELVKKCDILLGVFWTKLGSETTTHKSGSVEEISIFAEEEKDILVYFVEDKVTLQVATEKNSDLQKLDSYKAEFRQKGISQSYSVGRIKEDLYTTVSNYLRKNKVLPTPKTSEFAEDSTVGRSSVIDKNLTYIFHANAKHSTYSSIWHNLESGNYAKDFILSQLSKTAINGLLKSKEKGELSEISVLGIYYNDDDSPKNGVIIKLTDIKSNGVQVSFDFEYIKDTDIPSGLIYKVLGTEYSYRNIHNQFIVRIRESLPNIINMCNSKKTDYITNANLESFFKNYNSY